MLLGSARRLSENFPASVLSWDRQISLFARYFLAHVVLPSGKFSLLDVGCGTGAAIREIHRWYPDADLTGFDLEQEHVRISREMSGGSGLFYQGGIENVEGRYDFIYASNILEHLADWEQIALKLLASCKVLYALVPYREQLPAAPMESVAGVAHLVSFDETSFSGLREARYGIKYRVIRTPSAWGPSLKRECGMAIRRKSLPTQVLRQRELLARISRDEDDVTRMSKIRPPLAVLLRLAAIREFWF